MFDENLFILKCSSKGPKIVARQLSQEISRVLFPDDRVPTRNYCNDDQLEPTMKLPFWKLVGSRLPRDLPSISSMFDQYHCASLFDLVSLHRNLEKYPSPLTPPFPSPHKGVRKIGEARPANCFRQMLIWVLSFGSTNSRFQGKVCNNIAGLAFP